MTASTHLQSAIGTTSIEFVVAVLIAVPLIVLFCWLGKSDWGGK